MRPCLASACLDSPWSDGLVGPGGVQESRMSSANDHCINTPGLKQEKKEMATKGDKSGRLGLDSVCIYIAECYA